jgi:hypothetical protein
LGLETPFFDSLAGKPVSHIWRGYGSAIFIEFGELTFTARRDGSAIHPDGELTLMIEWSWRIEKPRSILGGSWSSERRWPAFFNVLTQAKVLKAETFGVLPEIVVWLDNGLRVASFMTADGQPSWALISRVQNIGSLCVKRGKLHVEGSNASHKKMEGR